jgi:hypothetical protein
MILIRLRVSDDIRIRSLILLALLLMLPLSAPGAGEQNFLGVINGSVTDQGGAGFQPLPILRRPWNKRVSYQFHD